jgi:hypothetical protein
VPQRPFEPLHKLHGEALGFDVVPLVGDQLVFSDPADQALSVGLWRVVACGMNGSARNVEITIPPPARAAT